MTERQPLDPDLRLYLDRQARAFDGPARSPEEARARMLQQLRDREIPGLPNRVTAQDHRLGENGLRLRIYTPPKPLHSRPMPVLVYLHGGGWAAGSVETHDPFCRLLAPLAGVSIVSVDYRLAPESPYPAALEDAHEAVLWTVKQAAGWGADPAHLALGGDSAGGHLAAVIANRLAIERDAPKLRALLLLYPVTDHYSGLHGSYAENGTGFGLEATTMRWYWDLFAGGASPDDPAVSPLRVPHLPPLPPTLLATAQYDVLRDEGIAYARKLRDGGVSVRHLHSPDMHHNYPVGPGTVARFPQSDRALGQFASWLRGALAGPPSDAPG